MGFDEMLGSGFNELGMAIRRSATDAMKRMNLEDCVNEISVTEDDGGIVRLGVRFIRFARVRVHHFRQWAIYQPAK